MPWDSGSERRNISPFWRSSSETASSTVKTWTPDLETISRVCCSALPAGSGAVSQAAANATAKASVRIGSSRRLQAFVMMGVYRNGGTTATARFLLPPRRRRDFGLVGGEHVRAAIRPHFGGHHALRSRAEPHQHGLAGPQLGDAVAAQRLHVNEDIRRALA